MKKLILSFAFALITMLSFGQIFTEKNLPLSSDPDFPLTSEEYLIINQFFYIFDKPINFTKMLNINSYSMTVKIRFVNIILNEIVYTDTTFNIGGDLQIDINFSKVVMIETTAQCKIFTSTKSTLYDNVYSEADVDEAYDNGVASVSTTCVQDFTQADINKAYSDGVASVPTCVQDFTQTDIDAAYDNGYEDGVASVGTSGTKVNTMELNVNVYPNPTTNYVTIDVADYDYTEVYDITGVLVKTENATMIDLTDLYKGTYILKVYDYNGGVENVRVVYE